MRYILEKEAAAFCIQQEPLGMWDLWVNGQPTLTFATPEEAAKSVYKQDTGYIVWDQLETHDAPEDLAGWARED